MQSISKEEDTDAVIVVKKPIISNATKNCREYAEEVIMSHEYEEKQAIAFHLEDCHNVHDEDGSIHVGGHRVDSEIQNYLKEYQIGGVRFMFANINSGSGCILAHEMGLGKSLQVICLCDVLLKYTEERRIVCVVPINTLENWRIEFSKWLPNYVDTSESRFQLHVVSERMRKKENRCKIVLDWNVHGGILLIGYELFRLMLDNEDTSVREALLQSNILICDEGHRLKNENSSTYTALNGLYTRKRIILTGYPLQNHVKEYYYMVNFVRPEYLRSFNEFAKLFMVPIQNAHFGDGNAGERMLMLQRVFVLNMLLKPIVQRRSNILESTLPQKFHFVIPVGLTLFQRRLLHEYYEKSFLTEKNILMAFSSCINICNHPDILFKVKHKEWNAWIGPLMDDYKQMDINESPKMKILFSILEESVKMGDRVVVFSQSITTLDLLEIFLWRDNGWKRDEHYFRLDGSVNSVDRMVLVERFNLNNNINLFLISTKAGCVGINLVGANRLVLVDVSWNPCHDNQAISRVYRYNQTKQTYIYRLVSEHSLEKLVYYKQVRKQSMAHRLVDSRNPPYSEVRDKLMEWLVESEISVDDHERNYDDIILNKVIQTCTNEIVKKPFSHDDMLRDIVEQDGLSMDGKILSVRSYLDEAAEYDEVEKKSTQKVKKKVADPLPVDKKAPVTTDAKVHSWVSVKKWKEQGFEAGITISQEDFSITTKTKTVKINKDQKIVVIRHSGKIYIETEEGVLSVKDIEIQRKLNI